MLRWLLRALAFLAVASVFTMHGASADGVTPDIAPVTTGAAHHGHGGASDQHDQAAPDHDDQRHWHHFAMACVAVVATAVAVLARRRGVSVARFAAARVAGAHTRLRASAPPWRPPPPWLELGVVLR